jgi:hypothetical protein
MCLSSEDSISWMMFHLRFDLSDVGKTICQMHILHTGTQCPLMLLGRFCFHLAIYHRHKLCHHLQFLGCLPQNTWVVSSFSFFLHLSILLPYWIGVGPSLARQTLYLLSHTPRLYLSQCLPKSSPWNKMSWVWILFPNECTYLIQVTYMLGFIILAYNIGTS